MRVLHVMEATIGGTRRHLVDVARGQRRAGLDVHLVASTLREPAFEADLVELEREGCGVTRLPMQRAIRPGRDARHLRELQRRLEALAPDVVHTHSSKAGVLGRLASLGLERGARVHTPHTFAFLFQHMFGALERAVFRAIETALAQATERTIAVSESEAATMRASGVVPPERVRVVPNGVDPLPWRAAVPVPRAELGLPREAVVAAVVGLLNVAKGQDLALRALALLGDPRVHLLVIGEGELRPELERLVGELGLRGRVHLLGWRDDVPRLVRTADLTVLPSRWEGMPYAVLEAMAAERPVVAARVDGARDLVEEGVTGTTCAVDDAADLARALRRLVERSPEERRALGRAGAERLQAGYTLERMIARLLDVYAELV